MSFEKTGVFSLLTTLCRGLSKDQDGSSRPETANKMRSRAFELLLHRGNEATSCETPDGSAVSHLLSYYYVTSQNARSVAEKRDARDLYTCIENITERNLCEVGSDFEAAVRLLLALKDEVPKVHSTDTFQPFSFGLLDKILPRLPRDEFGSSLPYQYYHPHMFELPFSLSRQDLRLKGTASVYTEYNLENFRSHPVANRQSRSQVMVGGRGMKMFELSTSMLPQPNSGVAVYSNDNALSCPRLVAPRDLAIPKMELKTSEQSKDTFEVEEMFRAVTDDKCDRQLDIWDLASSEDKIITTDIWEIASKLPPVEERRLIASSPRELTLWTEIYGGRLHNMHVISEKLFIRHLMYLTIGIESQSFRWNKEQSMFAMRPGLSLEGLSRESLQGYVAGLLSMGTCYRRLHRFAFDYGENLCGEGYVFEAARNVIRRFLLSFRHQASSVFSCFTSPATHPEALLLPSLLQVEHQMEPLRYQIETAAAMFKLIDSDDSSLPRGGGLMSYLFTEMSLVTRPDTARIMFRSLYHICTVYFKFIERLIFEGELEDPQQEFFVRREPQHARSRCQRYWTRGLYLVRAAVPPFLAALAAHVLLCGKSFRLLKLCNPMDPLVLLISSDHPSVTCCLSFDQLERQQRALDVYRTRCLFVSGEPVTFDQIMLRKEAERKAFTEMAAVKQAETMEKIVAERKRLAQLIIAEKQHNLRVLETAIAETEAARKRRRRVVDAEKQAGRARDQTDAVLRDQEKNKMLEYYSKLNEEVEKRKAHTEWKIKRLQLDSERMQLLSTEDRNLKREKLELEHKNDDGSCSASIYSNDCMMTSVERLNDDDLNDIIMADADDNAEIRDETRPNVRVTSVDTTDTIPLEEITSSKTLLDNEGNVVKLDQHTVGDVVSSNSASNYREYMNMRLQAIKNKEKVLSHECGQVDSENNFTAIKYQCTVNLVDDENNIRTGCKTQSEDPFCEAKRNRNKVLSRDNITPLENIEATSDNYIYKENFTNNAHAEAWRNRLKVMGTEEDSYMLSQQHLNKVYDKDREISVASLEAEINRKKGLGTINDEPTIIEQTNWSDHLTDAQKEALINKKKVLGTEYHIDIKHGREPINVAQEEAARNKKKILNSEYGISISSSERGDRRSNLKLDLKQFDGRLQDKLLLGITPTTTGGITPGDFYTQLELETPNTAEIPLIGPPTNEALVPNANTEDIFDVSNRLSEGLVSSEGFKFPSIILEEENAEITNGDDTTGIQESPSKVLDLHLNKHFDRIKSSIWNVEEQTYNFESFDPFGIRGATVESKGFLSNKMNVDTKKSCYTNPADIIMEAQKKPLTDIFGGYNNFEDENECEIENVNIATLTACFQRSVLLPLFYQLEMVNNSILTHYLVNLDMYEHLRSLKDYFFLMDGEFSSTICENLFQKLVKTINPEELLNFATLHSILDKAIGSSIANVNKYSENLSFTITDPPLSFQHSSPDVLQCLSLSYAVTWPMNIILSPEALTRYAKCFQFLLKMRRISWSLGQDFEVLKLAVKLAPNARQFLRSPQYNSVQLYRHVMASLVRALDHYLVTTCLHTSWTELERELQKARTLDDLHDCHAAYIKKVLFRCLLNKRSAPVMKLLNDMFTVILRFSRDLHTKEWVWNESTKEYTNPSFDELTQLFRLFERLARHLLRTVTRLTECGYQPHLVELLAAVNLNDYYGPAAKSPNTSLDV